MYITNFADFAQLTNMQYQSPEDFLMAGRRKIEADHYTLDEDALTATVVVGYSGNGKTTYIMAHQADEDRIASMDKVVMDLRVERQTDTIDPESIIIRFGQELELCFCTHKNIWVDGLWLNILTRGALITTLHEYGYRVRIVDLLDDEYVKKTIASRVEDIWRAEKKAEPDGSKQFKFMRNRYLEFHQNESKRNFVDLQRKYDMFRIGADEYFQAKL